MIPISITLLAFLLSWTAAPAYSDPSYVRAATQSQQQSGIRDLKPGQPIEDELAVSKSHSYRATLKAGEYIKVVVEQKGIDVAVTLIGTDGKKIVEVDSTSVNEKESIYVVGEASGEYTLEVRRQDSEATTGRYEIRIEEWRSATQQDRDRFTAQLAFSEGNAIGNQGQGTAESLRKGIEKFQQALLLWRAVEDRLEEASTLNQIGHYYSVLGDTQLALQYHNQALPLRRAMRDIRGESITLNNIGTCYLSMGESQKALEYYGQALILKQTIGDRKSEANTLYHIAGAYSRLGELQKALEYYDRALPLTRVTGERRGESLTLNSIGGIYYQMGDWQKASEYYSQALAIVRVLGDRRTESLMLYGIGTVYSQLGELQTALEYYNQSLQLRRTFGDKRGEAFTLSGIGSVYLRLGDSQKALDHYNQALPLMRAVGDKYGEAHMLSNIGTAYSNSGKFENAKDYFDQALRVNQAVGDRVLEAATLRNLGSAYVKLKEFEKAMEYLSPALKICRAIGDRSREAVILSDIARVERDQKRLSEALAQIEASLAIVESTRQSITSQELRASYMTTKRSSYEFSIDLLMQMHKDHPSAGHQSLALQASERARARSLLDMLTEARADIRQGADPVLLDRERSLQQQLSIKSERLTKLLGGKHTEEQERAARKELEILLGEYKEVQTKIRTKSPRYAALTQPQPLSLKEIQQEILDEETLLLEYSLGEERSYLWAVSASDISAFELPKRADVESLARRVYELLTARNQQIKFETPEKRRNRIAKADAEYPQAAGELSKMLLGPVKAQMKNKRLLIVADGVLQYIPFAALPSPEDQRQATPSKLTPLIASHEVVSLPSASTLGVLRKELVSHQQAPKIAAVLADPVFDKDDERVKIGRSKTSMVKETARPFEGRIDTKVSESELKRSVRDFGFTEDELYFPRLPSTRREAEAIVAGSPPAFFRKAVDFAASKSGATDAALGQYKYIHFATHALINSTHPELSGIVLSLVDEKGADQDGFLLLHEIYNLKLPAEMVVLSSCKTGLGKEIKGEGLIGLARGFMYAGAARVVVSLWDINDESTAELMSRLYRGLLGKQRLRPAAALRAAQLSVWRSGRWQAPYYWSGFVLQGEYK
ncbi:MAG TPA: CHAT domain-containing tetratricopeptide repeat protein [Blastocatellia bacterium]|nr:CHAT domain-containing tetratricopeptide repeat protein [Blastocatellia bacterium]